MDELRDEIDRLVEKWDRRDRKMRLLNVAICVLAFCMLGVAVIYVLML